MKIFIIGGAGYIGSHMVKIAHKVGHDVITVDNLSTGHQDAVLYGEFKLCDILDTAKLDKLFKKHKPDAVMHFSAYSLVSESMTDPYKYYNNNVSGTLSLLKAMIDNNCMKFIFSSSAAIFGNPEYIPIDEKHPKDPINPYGKSKLMVEEILKDFELAYGLKYVSFRYFNAAGHDPDGELSERHDPETHLLPIIMQATNGQKDSVSVFGNDYDTKDGTCVRDYIHVNDLANAHLKGLDYLNQDESSSAEFNLGNGNGFSVKEVVQKVKDITGKDFVIVEKGRREGDPSTLIASDDKAQKILGLNISFSSLEKIIKTLVVK
ncbi:UDP-glucose 4-epimerase GalE [Candidatus Pseudothioglobus singularis]|nr:UDP-glucose 4-epimerase GalE [Candidatus Pseudothioglobus singularis]